MNSLKFVATFRINNIGSDNGLAPTRLPTIIWTNDGQITDAYMRHAASFNWRKTILQSDAKQHKKYKSV